MYEDREFLALVVYFADPVQTSSMAILADQYAQYASARDQPGRKQINHIIRDA